ncbi:hypothetical protein [Streptomyces syringium]|uniref:Uncharacterized protein n=1 Tax=Streptomyces syringium TaxID=76729 RepID=A0ABS4Y2P9_9ACTN|nr:hypothetical protein [Streptomyces syringium]MBP2403057.1 hypothetical protein [Streptomyces syringium]
MTYRVGVFVMDTRENRLMQVMGHVGDRVQVRTPGGGLEWEVPSDVLRLATSEERAAARAATTRLMNCAECAELETARRRAIADGDEEKAGDALVAVRSHRRRAHAL